MDKQLRESLGKILIQYQTAKWLSMETGAYVANEDMLDEIESYINDNYVSKDKLQELYKTGLEFEAKMGMAKKGNEYSAQFLDNILKAIDTLVSVPTPESEKV